MVAWDAGATLADRFRAHAGDHRHLYGYAMRGMAQDWEAGGPVRQVCTGWELAPSGSAIQLRLLAGVFRLVLAGRADQLRPFYPCLGGQGDPAAAWPVMRDVIGEHVAELARAVEVAPQTNEVGRSAALLAGLFDLVAATGLRRVRLLELGASAGLNLLVDQVGFTGTGWRWGPARSPLQLEDAVSGPVRPQEFTVAERRGCDLAPVDPRTAAGRQLLTSFVWPFDLHRHARLAAALALAARHPVQVDRAGAASWLAQRLAEEPGEGDADRAADGLLTVVWQSVTSLYWPSAEVAAVEELLRDSGRRRRVAWVTMEYEPERAPGAAGQPEATRPVLRTWLADPASPAGPRERRLGTVHDHGVPVWLDRPDP